MSAKAGNRRCYGARLRSHEHAVVEAEARLLARAIAPYGVLHRDALADLVGAARWREGGFQRALDAAVSAGVLERRPLDFYSHAARNAT